MRSTPINYSLLGKLNRALSSNHTSQLLIGFVLGFGVKRLDRDLESPRSAVSIRIKRGLSERILKDYRVPQLRIEMSITGNPKGDVTGTGVFGSFWQDKRDTPVIARIDLNTNVFDN